MTEGIALLLGCIQGLTEFLPIPIILGANLLEISRDWQGFTANSTFPITLGLLSAMASGYVALKLLVRIVHAGRLYLFSYYCWGVGLLILLFSVRGAFW